MIKQFDNDNFITKTNEITILLLSIKSAELPKHDKKISGSLMAVTRKVQGYRPKEIDLPTQDTFSQCK